MELKNCKKCKRTFGGDETQELCSKCGSEYIEEDFRKVRDYLYDYPGSDVKEVAEGTGVAEVVILRLLKQERIEVVKDKNLVRRCENCKKIIQTGRKCEDCNNNLAKDLMNAAASLKSSSQKDSLKKDGMGYHSKERKN